MQFLCVYNLCCFCSQANLFQFSGHSGVFFNNDKQHGDYWLISNTVQGGQILKYCASFFKGTTETHCSCSPLDQLIFVNIRNKFHQSMRQNRALKYQSKSSNPKQVETWCFCGQHERVLHDHEIKVLPSL